MVRFDYGYLYPNQRNSFVILHTESQASKVILIT